MMKMHKPLWPLCQNLSKKLILPLLATVALSWSGCASSRARNTESLLSAAGFHTLVPSTPQQKQCYEALQPYHLARTEHDGKIVYAFADKKDGLLYVGGEAQYDKFQQLAQEQRIARQEYAAAQMNQEASMDWGFWGPPGVWW